MYKLYKIEKQCIKYKKKIQIVTCSLNIFYLLKYAKGMRHN